MEVVVRIAVLVVVEHPQGILNLARYQHLALATMRVRQTVQDHAKFLVQDNVEIVDLVVVTVALLDASVAVLDAMDAKDVHSNASMAVE